MAERHGGLTLAAENSYAFAAEAIAIPLNAVEIGIARDYPIVFANAEPYMPLAVTGLKQGENLFVEKDGAWRAGAYVPAYVRRYPFALAKSEQAGNFTLCVDVASPRLGPKGGQSLFDGANASDTTKNAMQFCIAFEQEMVRASIEEGVLVFAVPLRATKPGKHPVNGVFRVGYIHDSDEMAMVSLRLIASVTGTQ